MNIFISEAILNAPAGFYWFRFGTQSPHIMYIRHSADERGEYYTKFGFDYPDSETVRHGSEFPEHLKGLVITGPILPPHF